MVIRPRRGAWVFLVLSMWLVLSPLFSSFAAVEALTEQGDTVIFSYNESTIHQEVLVNTSEKTELFATVRAAEYGYGVDRVLVGIALYGPGGGGIYFHDTGWVELTPGGYTDISLSVDAESVGIGWGDVYLARLTIGGDDGEFWAGNYGPSIESASLKLDGVELIENNDFSKGSQNWTSSVGWQTCHATQGNKPCSSLESRINNSSYTTTSSMVWAEANEGWDLSVSAPDGGVFSRVIFASYGNPSGTEGQYTQGWCHSTSSILKVSQVFVGLSSGTISASNGVFGDPCGGTYKRLHIVIEYVGATPPTTTTTTTTVPETTTTVPETTTTVPETTTTEVVAPTTIPPIVETTTTTISSTTTTEPPKIVTTTVPEVPVEQTPPTALPEPAPDQEAEEEAVQLEEALGQINNGALTARVVNEVIDAILSGNVSQEQIKEAVTALIEAEAISEEAALELATSPEVIQSLDSEQASEVFAAVEVENLTDEQAKEIVAAVQNASEEVREAFEEEINVFDGAFDDYVPTGSSVSVEVRRVIVAATAVLSITGVATGTAPQVSSRRIA